jgi:hypothetical protein
MLIAGWVMMVVGLVVYIVAFGMGAGPTMGDKPLQASAFSIGTILMILGFIFVAVI